MEIPDIAYEVKMNSSLVEQVKAGTLLGISFEGVVCKSTEQVSGEYPLTKLKSQAWLDKLRARCAGDEALFKKLA